MVSLDSIFANNYIFIIHIIFNMKKITAPKYNRKIDTPNTY